MALFAEPDAEVREMVLMERFDLTESFAFILKPRSFGARTQNCAILIQKRCSTY